jgi:hypothetical protein
VGHVRGLSGISLYNNPRGVGTATGGGGVMGSSSPSPSPRALSSELWRSATPLDLDALALPSAAVERRAAAGGEPSMPGVPSAVVTANKESNGTASSSAQQKSSVRRKDAAVRASPSPPAPVTHASAPSPNPAPEESEGAEPVSVGSVAELSHFIESQKQKKQQQQQQGGGGGGGGKAGSSKKHSAPNSAKKGNQSRSASKKDKSSTNGTDPESVAEEASQQRIPSGKKRGGRSNPSPHVASASSSAAAKKRARSKRELDADASALALSASKRRGGFRSAKSLLLSALGVLLAALVVYALFFTTLAPDESVPNNKPRTTTATRA